MRNRPCQGPKYKSAKDTECTVHSVSDILSKDLHQHNMRHQWAPLVITVYLPPSWWCEHRFRPPAELRLTRAGAPLTRLWYGRGHPANSHGHNSALVVDGAGYRLVEMDNRKLDRKRVVGGTATGIPVGRLPLLTKRCITCSLFQGCKPDIDTPAAEVVRFCQGWGKTSPRILLHYHQSETFNAFQESFV